MHRITLTALAAVTALTAVACGSHGSKDSAQVVATTDAWGSVAGAVAGNHTTVKSILTNPQDDPHSYEATPADAAEIGDASLVIYNGGGYDHWADTILANRKNVKTVNAYSLLPPGAPGAPPANEHVFYNLDVVKAVATKIADDLAAADPASAEAYRVGAAEFNKQADAIAVTERAIGQNHPGASVVATEPVAHYLLATAGIADSTPRGFAEAAESGHDPSPADLAAVLDLINGHHVSALVVNKQTETAVTKQLQEAAQKAALPVIEVTETLPAGLDYLTWQRQTAESFARQLDGAPAAHR